MPVLKSRKLQIPVILFAFLLVCIFLILNSSYSIDEEYYIDKKTYKIKSVESNVFRKIGSWLGFYRVAILTFDDGPVLGADVKIANILDKYNAKAIWFINCKKILKNGKPDPDISSMLRKLISDGNIIGNHGFSHLGLVNLDEEHITREIKECNSLIKKITGIKPKYLRPPFGGVSDRVIRVAEKLDMQVVNWTVNTYDVACKKPGCFDIVNYISGSRASNPMHDGANILMHSNSNSIVEALPELMKKLTQNRYNLVLPSD